LTDIAETVTGTKQIVVTPAVTQKRVDFQATVSTDDTITISDLTTIDGAALLKLSDGTAVTCTVATNVITITQSPLSSVAIEGFALGT